MSGWIKIHREIQRHWIFQDAEKFKWWIDMLFLASYEDNKTLVKNQIANVKRGQFIGSLSFLAKRWCVSRDRVAAFLKLLQSEGMITKESDKNVTQITICNYESYQDAADTFSTPSLHLADTSPTPCRQTKEIQEIQEINITNNSACAYTREENVGWVESVERGFVERYKAQGCPMAAARATGKKAQEILQLLEVYSATREAKGRGHRDFEEFRNLFLWHVQNDKISIPVVRAEKSSPKVIGNAELRKMMEESGWQS